MMHGMTRSQLNRMVFLENMIIGIGAIVVGIGVGILTGKLFLMIGSRMIGIDQLPFILSIKALLLTTIAFLLLFFCISLFTTILVGVNKLIDLFQAGEKPKKEQKLLYYYRFWPRCYSLSAITWQLQQPCKQYSIESFL